MKNFLILALLNILAMSSCRVSHPAYIVTPYSITEMCAVKPVKKKAPYPKKWDKLKPVVVNHAHSWEVK